MTDAREDYRNNLEMTDAQSRAIEQQLAAVLAREVKRINLMSKLKALPALAKDTMAELEAQAERLTARLENVKSRGAEAFGKWHSELDATEQTVSDAENAINQLSNGGPPLGN